MSHISILGASKRTLNERDTRYESESCCDMAESAFPVEADDNVRCDSRP